jgi:hypothetical protein
MRFLFVGSSHRGLSPHKLMPMSGVHKPMHRTVNSRLRRLSPAGDGQRVRRLEGAVVVDLLPPILFFVIFVAVIGHFAYRALSGHPAIPLEPSRGT